MAANNSFSRKILLTACLIVLVPCYGMAQESKWYVGIGAGLTRADFNPVLVPEVDYHSFVPRTGPSSPFTSTYTGSLIGKSEDDSAGNVELLVGYQFHEYWAAELAWQRIGEVSSTGRSDETETSGPGVPPGSQFSSTYQRTTTNSRESQSVSLAISGSLPLSDRFSLLGQLGVVHSDAELLERSTTSSSATITVTDRSENTTSWFAGVGADFVLSQRITLRGSYRYFPDVNDQINGLRILDNRDNGAYDLQQFTFSLLYRF